MRILVMGAGAIGSVFGGLLAEHGESVTLLGRRPHMQAIERDGLRITGLFGDHLVRDLDVAESVSEIQGRDFDLVLVTVKSYDTARAVAEVGPLVGPGTLAISLQNGLGNVETISGALGERRTLGGRVIFGVTTPEPGHVEVTVYAEELMLGSPTNAVPMARIEEIASCFSAAGIPTKATAEINKFIWAKILYNCALNPLAAILGTTYGDLLKAGETRRLMREIIGEIFAVARTRGTPLFWENPEEYVDVLFGRLIPDTAAHHPSMLQDIRKGRRTEIDAMNGAIARFGEELGVPTPVNRLLTLLIKVREGLSASP